MRKKITILLILIILTILSFRYNEIFLANFLLENDVETSINGYAKDEKLVGLKPDYNIENVEELDFLQILKASRNSHRAIPKGRIIVPGKIDINIYEGLNVEHLSLGAAEQLPRSEVVAGGRGNYILAGHSWAYRQDFLFAPLKRVNVDEYIYVTDKENLYVYKSYIAEAIHKTDPYLLNIEEKDKHIITLYTCTGTLGIVEYRYTVQGELVKTYSLSGMTINEFEKITSVVK